MTSERIDLVFVLVTPDNQVRLEQVPIVPG